jgi:hypothetical protein
MTQPPPGPVQNVMVIGPEIWTVDGYNLSSYAHDIQVWDGLDLTPDIKGSDTDIPQRHGLLPGVNYFTEAHKAVSMVVNTADYVTGIEPTDVRQKRANFDYNLDQLVKIFYRRKLLNVVRQMSNAEQRQAYCKCVAGIQPVTLGIAGAQVTFDLMLPYSFWRDLNPTTQASAAGLAAGAQVRFDLFDAATAPMTDLQYRIDGPITNPKVTCLETGAWFQLTGTLATGQSVTFDASTMTVTPTGGFVVDMAMVTHGGDPRWLSMVPSIDGCKLQLDGAGLGAATKLTVTGKRAFLR